MRGGAGAAVWCAATTMCVVRVRGEGGMDVQTERGSGGWVMGKRIGDCGGRLCKTFRRHGAPGGDHMPLASE